MDIKGILEVLKELTLDLVAGKRNRAATVMELRSRIEADLVYSMNENEAQRDFITQVYVSLDNLITEDFPPSPAEIKYFAECFEGKRDFNLAEVRKFELISSGPEEPPDNIRKARKTGFKKTREKKNNSGMRKPGIDK